MMSNLEFRSTRCGLSRGRQTGPAASLSRSGVPDLEIVDTNSLCYLNLCYSMFPLRDYAKQSGLCTLAG
jgi:hypothetical protein